MALQDLKAMVCSQSLMSRKHNIQSLTRLKKKFCMQSVIPRKHNKQTVTNTTHMLIWGGTHC